MAQRTKQDNECAARLLALVVASSGHVDPRELAQLDELDACRRLGVTRTRFVGLAQDAVRAGGRSPSAEQWPLDRLLDAVHDPAQRLLLCRFAAAVVTADGRVSPGERRVYERMLAWWGVSDAMVAQAIREDRVR